MTFRIWHTSMRVPALALALCALACTAETQEETQAPVIPFSVARVRIISGADTSTLRVELATSGEQQRLGLMERSVLADTAGMLFLYPGDQPPTAGFWMFRTRIPLDIAFLDSLGTIRSIAHMVPCTATIMAGCPTYPPGIPYRAALEVNAGYLALRKLAVGDRVILSDTSQLVAAPARP